MNMMNNNTSRRRIRQQPSGCKLLVVVMLVAVAVGVVGVVASSSSSHSSTPTTLLCSSSSSRPQQQHDAISLSRSKLYRWRQRWQNKNIDRRIPRLKSAKNHNKNHKGTVVTWFRPPTSSDLSNWFWQGASSAAAASSSSPSLVASATATASLFNHDTAGMTNPCLHVDSSSSTSTSERQGATSFVSTQSRRQQKNTKNPLRSTTILVTGDEEEVDCKSDTDNTAAAENSWWPAATACPLTKGAWHTIRMRQHVGIGWNCYQRVRDAALQWEFDSKDDECGIRSVDPPSSSNNNKRQRLDYQEQQQRRGAAAGRSYSVHPIQDVVAFRPSQNAMQIWSGPGGRRLATYTRKGWLLYVTNPVSVLYDFVDQRSSGRSADGKKSDDDGTIYSSTAYGTCKGHWLCGEERVTVAYRPCTGNVDVEILSLSKPAPKSLIGRWVWPFVTKKDGPQQTFFREQMKFFQRIASPSGGGEVVTPPTPAANVGGGRSNQRQIRNDNNNRIFDEDELTNLSLLSLNVDDGSNTKQ